MDGLVFQIKDLAWKAWQVDPDEMGIRRPVEVGVQPPDRLAHPLALCAKILHAALLFTSLETSRLNGRRVPTLARLVDALGAMQHLCAP